MPSCLNCSKEFVKASNVQKFCSSECLKAGRAPRCAPLRVVACQGCSVKFETTDQRKNFCTNECRWTHANNQRPTSRTEFRNCVVCGTAFQPMQKTGPGRKWCSESCRHVMGGNAERLKRHLSDETPNQTLLEAARQERRRRVLKTTFGLSLEAYEKMHEAQNGLCAICHKPETAKNNYDAVTRKLAVDHCHKTGKIRQLLCTLCNQGLGSFKDDPVLIQAAIEYLKSHTGD